MKTVTIQELAQYENQYIALAIDRSKILASGKTIKELESKLKEFDMEETIIEFVEPLNKFLSPLCQ